MMDRLWHDANTPQDARALRSETRELVESQMWSLVADIDHVDESVESFPREAFNALASAGLFGVPFRPDVGGRGLTHPTAATATVIEELAYASNSVAAVYDVHCILAGASLAQGGSDVCQKYLRAVVSGQMVGAFATTEPDASSDLSPSAIKTVATPTNDGYVVTGRKRFISNSPVADFIVTLCRTGDSLSLLVLDTTDSRVRIGSPDRKMGNRGQLTADVDIAAVEVPARNRVGAEGDGLRIALSTLTLGRIGIAASGVGLAQAAFDLAVDHLSRRVAFGRPLAANQYWQFRLAERATELENARSLYLKAALRADLAGGAPEPEASMAKHYGTALAVDLARDAMQAFGGYGFVHRLGATQQRCRIEEIYRDAKIGEIYEGANEIQKWIIARQIFGRGLTG
jgi:alkylation response protein AidB-like acyl-CoA dehydrogenase